jgi:hypothetical protein
MSHRSGFLTLRHETIIGKADISASCVSRTFGVWPKVSSQGRGPAGLGRNLLLLI